MKKVVIAVDSFKGSLSSREVAEAFEAGFRSLFPDCVFQKISIADGGEGTLDSLIEVLGGERVEVEVSNPLLRPIKAQYGIIEGGSTAIIEMAAASGLTLLSNEERNPMLTTTFGTGEMIADAIKRGCRKLLIGIGGSATNDGGTGLCRALGYRFLDSDGVELIGRGEELQKIAVIDDSNVVPELRECEFVVACDVTNSLFGKFGAAHIFAPQKGADKAMVEKLDEGLRNFARVVAAYNGSMIALVEGAGAAGGAGGGMKALLNAQLCRGIEVILKAAKFDQIIAGSDLIVTGEGRLDRQSLMGKVVSGVLSAATAQKIPTIAIAGGVEWCEELQISGFAAIEVVTPKDMPLDKAMLPDVAKENIFQCARRVAQRYLNQ